MCLIAYMPSGKAMPADHMVAAHVNNNDGIGVMSSDGVHKFLGRKALKRAKRYIETLVQKKLAHAIHFRYATHGAVTAANCHPFELPNGNGWLMHNGVLNDYTAKSTREHSDTYFFAQEHVHADASLTEGDKHLEYWSAVAKKIGGNKLCIMLPDFRFILVNDDLGRYIDDIWYSQTYSLPSLQPRLSRWAGGNYAGGYGNYSGGYPYTGRYSEGYSASRGPYTNTGGYIGFETYAQWQERKRLERDNRRMPAKTIDETKLIGWRRHVDKESGTITYEKVDDNGKTDAERLADALDRRGVPGKLPASDDDKDRGPWLAWDRDKHGNDALDAALAAELKKLETNCALCFAADVPVDADNICEDCLREEASELDKGALLPGWAEPPKKETDTDAYAGECLDCGAKHDYVNHYYCGGMYCVGAGYKDTAKA